MLPGDKVRVRDNPSRVGTLASDPPVGEGNRRRLIVDFPEGTELVLASSLEKVERETRDALLLMERGQYGRVRDLRGAITHYRLSGKLANLIYSLNTTETDFHAFQFKPVLQYLDSPSKGIVIADEVGLGKTIEAGLIWTELRARQNARRLLVLCPAMLCEKWQRELANRMGVRAEIVSAAEVLNRLEALRERPYEEFALIGSVQGLRPPRGWNDKEDPSERGSARLARFLEESASADPLLDLIVIDEAHYLRNSRTLTNKLGQLLRPVTDGLVLLSATPIQTRSRDLFNLLHLLDEDAFPYERSYDESVRENAPIVALRDRVLREVVPQQEFVAALDEAIARRFLQQSEQLRHLKEHPPSQEELATPVGRSAIAEQLDRINPRTKVIARTLKRDVQELRVQRNPVTIKAPLSGPERDFYWAVTEAVREFCENNAVPEGFILTVPQRQMSSCMAAAWVGWQQRLASAAEEALAEDEELYDLGVDNEEHSLSESTNRQRFTLLGRALLSTLGRVARESSNANELAANDSKCSALLKHLRYYWADNPDRKVVLFAYFKRTLYYLKDRLAAAGVSAIVLHGGMNKTEILDEFASADGPRVLLSSEVASEGVDLQFASLVVNYDLPWNPAKIEQRIGRIDRIGQPARQILIWNVMHAETLDEKVHDRLLERLDIFREALGSMEEILGEKVKELTAELLTHRLSPEAENKAIEQAALALENLRKQQADLEERATELIGHGEFIQNKVKAANELGRYIRGEDLLAYVRDHLEEAFPGTRFLASESRPLEITTEMSVDARVQFGQFLTANRLQGRTQVLAQYGPRLLFDNRAGAAPRGFEKVTQDHPLVRFATDRQRGAAGPAYFPTAAVEVPSAKVAQAPGVYVFAVMRWTFSGARDREQLVYRARHLETGELFTHDAAERLVNAAALHGIDWHGGAASSLNHASAARAQDDCRAEMEEEFRSARDALERENRDRIRLMVGQLMHDLERRRASAQERMVRWQASDDPRHRRLVAMERGRIKQLQQKYEERTAELRMREELDARDRPVSSGVIKVS